MKKNQGLAIISSIVLPFSQWLNTVPWIRGGDLIDQRFACAQQSASPLCISLIVSALQLIRKVSTTSLIVKIYSWSSPFSRLKTYFLALHCLPLNNTLGIWASANCWRGKSSSPVNHNDDNRARPPSISLNIQVLPVKRGVYIVADLTSTY